MDNNRTKLLAVYGTLRQGFYNHDYIKDSEYIGTYKTKSFFYLICLGPYPILVPESFVSIDEKKELKVKGNEPVNIVYELYLINEETWKNICYLEGFNGIRDHKDNEYDTIDIETEKGLAEIFIQKVINYEGIFVNSGDYSLYKGIVKENCSSKK